MSKALLSVFVALRVAVFALIISSIQPTKVYSSNQLVPLDEVLQQEISPVTVSYALERCASLYQLIASDVRKRRDLSDSNQLANEYEEFVFNFINRALYIREVILKSDSAKDEILRMMPENMKMYSALMDAEYLRSGQTLSEALWRDVETCLILLER